MKSKKIAGVLSATSLVWMCSVPVFAQNPIYVEIDHTPVAYTSEMGQPFVDEENRTQVPFRKTMEQFGCIVSWDKANNMAVAQKDNTIVKVPIGKEYILKNGEQIASDTAAIIQEARTYIPIRIVVESFGGSVNWEEANNTVSIFTSEPTTPDKIEVLSTITIDNAIDLIEEHINPSSAYDETASVRLVYMEQPKMLIDNRQCYVLDYGENTPDKFTATRHFAVSIDGSKIYEMNVVEGGIYELVWSKDYSGEDFEKAVDKENRVDETF